MMKIKIIILILILNNILIAAPAQYSWKEYKDSDGETMVLKIKGDEYFNSYEDTNGNEVKFSRKNKKFYKYDISNNKVILSKKEYKKSTNYDEEFKVNKINLLQKQKSIHLRNKLKFNKRK